MGLGRPEDNVCKDQFKEAMYPIAGNNVNLPEVDQNFGALGTAVYKILTDKADTLSDKNDDTAFWTWIEEVNKWLLKLSTWQKEVNEAIKDWTPTQAPEIALREALTELAQPGDPPANAPTTLKGRIE